MLRRLIALLGARASGIAFAFVFNLLIARQLPEADYSLAIYYYSWVVLASLIARNGNHVWIPREMARALNLTEKIDVAVKGVSQAVIYAGTIALAPVVYFWATQPDTGGRVDSLELVAVMAISGAIVAHSICETLSSILVGLKMPMTAGITSFVLPNLLMFVGVLLVPIGTFFDYTRLLLASYGLVAAVALAVGFLLSRRKFPKISRPLFSLVPVLEHFPITSVALVLYLAANLDILVLGSVGSSEDMALFGFVFKIAASIAMLSVLPRMISGPVFSERYHAGDFLGLKNEYFRITGLMFVFAIFAGSSILVIFPHIAGFVGKYAGHGGVLHVILLGSVLNVMFGPLLLLLNMTENNESVWKYGAGYLVTKFTLLIAAYQHLNLFWYAVVGTIMVAVWNLLLLRLVVVRLKA